MSNDWVTDLTGTIKKAIAAEGGTIVVDTLAKQGLAQSALGRMAPELADRISIRVDPAVTEPKLEQDGGGGHHPGPVVTAEAPEPDQPAPAHPHDRAPNPNYHDHDPADQRLTDEVWLRQHLHDTHDTAVPDHFRLAVLLVTHEDAHPELEAAAPPRPARAYLAAQVLADLDAPSGPPPSAPASSTTPAAVLPPTTRRAAGPGHRPSNPPWPPARSAPGR